MRLGSKMNYKINALHDTVDKIYISDRAMDKRILFIILKVFQAFYMASVCKCIKIYNCIIWMMSKPISNKIRSNKTSPTGNEHVHSSSLEMHLALLANK